LRANACGFPELENTDYASVVPIRDLAEIADARLRAQSIFLDRLERPEAIICKMSSNQTLYMGTTSSVVFDTTIYCSRYGGFSSSSVMMSFSDEGEGWRPGIYLCGASLDSVANGTIDSCWLDLTLRDMRGPRAVTPYVETSRNLNGKSSRGAIALHAVNLVEVKTPGSVAITAYVGGVGSGDIVVDSSSARLWALRIRGSSDV